MQGGHAEMIRRGASDGQCADQDTINNIKEIDCTSLAMDARFVNPVSMAEQGGGPRTSSFALMMRPVIATGSSWQAYGGRLRRDGEMYGPGESYDGAAATGTYRRDTRLQDAEKPAQLDAFRQDAPVDDGSATLSPHDESVGSPPPVDVVVQEDVDMSWACRNDPCRNDPDNLDVPNRCRHGDLAASLRCEPWTARSSPPDSTCECRASSTLGQTSVPPACLPCESATAPSSTDGPDHPGDACENHEDAAAYPAQDHPARHSSSNGCTSDVRECVKNDKEAVTSCQGACPPPAGRAEATLSSGPYSPGVSNTPDTGASNPEPNRGGGGVGYTSHARAPSRAPPVDPSCDPLSSPSSEAPCDRASNPSDACDVLQHADLGSRSAVAAGYAARMPVPPSLPREANQFCRVCQSKDMELDDHMMRRLLVDLRLYCLCNGSGCRVDPGGDLGAAYPAYPLAPRCPLASLCCCMPLGCACRGDLGMAHLGCALLWFASRACNVCEVCGLKVANVPEDQLRRLLARRRHIDWSATLHARGAGGASVLEHALMLPPDPIGPLEASASNHRADPAGAGPQAGAPTEWWRLASLRSKKGLEMIASVLSACILAITYAPLMSVLLGEEDLPRRAKQARLSHPLFLRCAGSTWTATP
eukprot:jgi/Mesvir1/16677/Mv15079-RA.2